MSDSRPLSPHLGIYKKLLTAVFSILHRLTGIGLSIGSIFITLLIVSIAMGPQYFFYSQLIFSMFVFKFILFLWTLYIFYHLYNGIRYLFWSFGTGIELKTVYISGYLVLFFTLISTIGIWFVL